MIAPGKPSPVRDLCLYGFTNEQSARLENMRMALRGLSELATAASGPDMPPIEIHGENLAAIFELFDDDLGACLGPDAVRTFWLTDEGEPA